MVWVGFRAVVGERGSQNEDKSTKKVIFFFSIILDCKTRIVETPRIFELFMSHRLDGFHFIRSPFYYATDAIFVCCFGNQTKNTNDF